MLHQIGAGTLGPVFRAYDPEQDKLVAVKLFRLDLPPERVHQLVAELQRVIDADLTHAAIAAPIAAGIVGVSAYLAQDFVAADSLDTVVREHGPAPVAEAVRVMTQLAAALDFASAADVMHGALHPRDVLISPDDARMTGLGVTRALERVGVPPPVRRPYTAPERAAAGSWDRRADVFSLAALAHELLWGRRIAATGAEAAAALADLPGARLDALRVVFARALADDPANRFETARGFADALKSAFSRQSTVDTRQSARPTTANRRLTAAEPLLPLDGGEADDTVATPPPEDDDATVPEDPPTLVTDDDDTVPAPPLDGQAGIDADDMVAAGEGAVEDDFDIAAVLNRVDEAPDDDLMLRAAEAGGFDDVETAPEVAPEPPVEIAPPASAPPAEIIESDVPSQPAPVVSVLAPPIPEPVLSRAPAALVPAAAREMVPPGSARPAVWPLSLALVVGIAVGFTGGYWLGSAEREKGRTTAAADPSAREVDTTPPSPAAAPVNAEAARGAPVPVKPPAAAVKPAAPVATGRLTIRSTPAGARVLVDGRDVGKSPVTVRDLSRGTHTVRVIRGGYTTQERSVSITAARPNPSVTLRLPRAAPAPAAEAAERQAAPLAVESRPTGAAVFLDGQRVGTTPLTIAAVPIGSHAVRLELSGYTTWSSSVRVVAGEQNRVAASLEPVKR